MGKRCCCGRFSNIDEPILVNKVRHEPIGQGNFCGPMETRIIERLKEENDGLKALCRKAAETLIKGRGLCDEEGCVSCNIARRLLAAGEGER